MDAMNNFVGLSAVLTGFDASVLNPQLDVVDIKSTYIQAWSKNVSDESGDASLPDNILNQYQSLRAQQPPLSDQQIGEKMLDDSNGDAFVMACRQLIFLWYMGAWPSVTSEPGTDTGGRTDFTTLSGKSYTAGLVWRVMQSHPMGDSNYRYGYWTTAPAPLSDYTGNKAD